MSLNVPSGFAQCVLSFSIQGSTRRSAVTLGVNQPDTGAVGSIADAVYAAVTGTGKPFVPTAMFAGYTFEGVDVYRGPSSAGYQESKKVPVVGTATGSGLPSNCAQLIRKNTALGGRHFRGRLFLPPCNIAESQVNNVGAIDVGMMSVLQAQWNAVFTALTDSNHPPVLFHGEDEEVTLPTPITGFSVQSVIATQRRRMR